MERGQERGGSAAFFLGGFGFSMAYVALFHHLGYVDVGAADAGRMAAVAWCVNAVETLPAKGSGRQRHAGARARAGSACFGEEK